MYPVLFQIGSFEITSFGVLVATGALVGMWLFQRELRRSQMDPSAVDAAVAGVLGGLAGAKLLWVVEHHTEDTLLNLILSRGGMSWFGGFAGGIAAGLIVMQWKHLPKIAVLAAAAPGLAIGQAIGRIGCFLVGDDYGRPTDLPWGIAFPKGLPPISVRVHPTQLYEAIALIPVSWLLLRWRRVHRSDRFVLGAYLTLAGIVRFTIEFVRVDVRVFYGLSVAHLASLLAIIVGASLWLTARRA